MIKSGRTYLVNKINFGSANGYRYIWKVRVVGIKKIWEKICYWFNISTYLLCFST